MAFNPLFWLNTLIPKDQGSEQIARDIPYGPEGRQKLDIYAPKSRQGALPVVVFIYGGSWSDGDRNNYTFAGRALAALGYIVVVPDYRLLPEVEYPAFLRDCADATAWCVSHIVEYGGNPRKLALMGHSAGAYNAVMIATQNSIIDEIGMQKGITCVVGMSGPYDFFPFDGPISIRTFGAVRDPEATQPINHVSDATPPMLLISGDKDTIVSPRNTRALASRLRAHGVEAVERHYARLDHPGPLLAMCLPLRWTAPVMAQVREFLARHLA